MHLMTSRGKSSGVTKEINLAKNTNCYRVIKGCNILIISAKFAVICCLLIRNVMVYTKGFKYTDLEAASIEVEKNVI